jgi:hypothetical protein
VSVATRIAAAERHVEKTLGGRPDGLVMAMAFYNADGTLRRLVASGPPTDWKMRDVPTDSDLTTFALVSRYGWPLDFDDL